MKQLSGYSAVIAVDIDGTLVGGGQAMCRQSILALNQLRKHNPLFVPVTGRMAVSARNIAENAHISGPLVCYNGAWVEVDKNQIIYRSSLPVEASSLIAEAISNHSAGCSLLVFSEDRLFYSSRDKRIDAYEARVGVVGSHIGSLDDIEGPVTKIIVSVEREDMTKYSKVLDELLAETGLSRTIAQVSSSAHHLELIPAIDNKGKGLKRLLEHLELTELPVISMGDADNDIPLFEISTLSICMGNGSENALQTADRRVSSVEQGGFAEACELVQRWFNAG